TAVGAPGTLDQCDGTGAACQHPAGNAGTVCRAAAGVCDVDESCTGSSTVCPADAFEPSSTVCRASAGECDPAEHCPGNGPSCPADANSPAGTACSAATNTCTVDQSDGGSDACQHPAGIDRTVCGVGAGACDGDARCTGSGK